MWNGWHYLHLSLHGSWFQKCLVREYTNVFSENLFLCYRSDDAFYSIVSLDISSEGYNNPEKIKSLLQERIENYSSIGSYSVTSENFKFTDLGGKVYIWSLRMPTTTLINSSYILYTSFSMFYFVSISTYSFLFLETVCDCTERAKH